MKVHAMPQPPLQMPYFLQRRVDAFAQQLLNSEGGQAVDFGQPRGEPALVGPDSVSWQIFKNPVAMFVGGVAAVVLELAEPRVRSGVWEHTSFRTQPVHRLQRTGLAAMVTIFGARSVAERMIAGVVRRHDKVRGTTPQGIAYQANDIELLTWVQATAGFGFAQAFHRYVRPLSGGEFARLYAEGLPAARLYGALDAPQSEIEMQALFERMRAVLEPSPIVFEFLRLMNDAPIFPKLWRPLQRLLIRAAVEITPAWVREQLGLSSAWGLGASGQRIVCGVGRLADRVMLPQGPAVQSCLRMGLPADYLYRTDTPTLAAGRHAGQ